jgi:hypothetical protein
VLPEAVTMDSSGKLSINYSAVLGLVVQAFNEYIDNTEARLSNLESRLNER